MSKYLLEIIMTNRLMKIVNRHRKEDMSMRPIFQSFKEWLDE